MIAARIAFGLIALQLIVMVSGADGRRNPPDVKAAGIACQVMEVHSDATLGATIAIFHQRDANDRNGLADFLRAHTGGSVQFVTADGSRHAARMFRLASCFGRGVLLFSSSTARLSAHDEITLRL